jgi:small subunit ribosomal protein S2
MADVVGCGVLRYRCAGPGRLQRAEYGRLLYSKAVRPGSPSRAIHLTGLLIRRSAVPVLLDGWTDANVTEAEDHNRRNVMAVATMKQLLEAGVHFGHQTRRWNPKMREFIFAERNGIHIIDLAQTVSRLDAALEFIRDTTRRTESVLFVGTKKQAQEAVREEATRAGQHYVDTRWLGGLLTNFMTIKRRIQRLEALEARREAGEFERLTKKEAGKLTEEIERLNHAMGGIRRMRRLPGAVFVVDPHREAIAVREARRLEIPVVAITDTNCDPDLIDWVIPANDDAIRSVRLLCALAADACLAGQAERQARIDEEMEQVEALPPVDEAALGPDADYSAALASGEALVFEPEPEEDEETERRARARRAASIEFDDTLDGEGAEDVVEEPA